MSIGACPAMFGSTECYHPVAYTQACRVGTYMQLRTLPTNCDVFRYLGQRSSMSRALITTQFMPKKGDRQGEPA